MKLSGGYGLSKFLIENNLKVPYYTYPRREGKNQRPNQTKQTKTTGFPITLNVQLAPRERNKRLILLMTRGKKRKAEDDKGRQAHPGLTMEVLEDIKIAKCVRWLQRQEVWVSFACVSSHPSDDQLPLLMASAE